MRALIKPLSLLLLLGAAVTALPGVASAQEPTAPGLSPADTKVALDTFWVMITGFSCSS